eukprot:2417546-Pyramimonas_sp.AAC.1
MQQTDGVQGSGRDSSRCRNFLRSVGSHRGLTAFPPPRFSRVGLSGPPWVPKRPGQPETPLPANI